MATQEEVQELARRLQDAAEVQRLQSQQIIELQTALSARAQQAQGQVPGGAVSATAGTEFGFNRTIDTRVLGRPDHFEGIPGTWRDWSTVFRAYAAACEPRLEQLMRDRSPVGSDPSRRSTSHQQSTILHADHVEQAAEPGQGRQCRNRRRPGGLASVVSIS